MTPLESIRAKCAQYWNEPHIGIEEMHAILEFIYREAVLAENGKDKP